MFDPRVSFRAYSRKNLRIEDWVVLRARINIHHHSLFVVILENYENWGVISRRNWQRFCYLPVDIQTHFFMKEDHIFLYTVKQWKLWRVRQSNLAINIVTIEKTHVLQVSRFQRFSPDLFRICSVFRCSAIPVFLILVLSNRDHTTRLQILHEARRPTFFCFGFVLQVFT